VIRITSTLREEQYTFLKIHREFFLAREMCQTKLYRKS